MTKATNPTLPTDESYEWVGALDRVDWDELARLYRIAPLGDKPPHVLETIFTNSMFRSFVYHHGRLVGAGRVLADGLDCAHLADVAVHPDHQKVGLGTAIVTRLLALASGHKKVILYANPGKEGFYARLGFLPMNTAMALWADCGGAIASGLVRPFEP